MCVEKLYRLTFKQTKQILYIRMSDPSKLPCCKIVLIVGFMENDGLNMMDWNDCDWKFVMIFNVYHFLKIPPKH